MEKLMPSFSPRLLLALAGLALVKLWLASGQKLQALPYAGLDDRLFFDRGVFLARGQWLGPYNELTLAKGPMYPLWIALSYWAGVPLQFGQQALYIAVCVVVIVALRPVILHSAATLTVFALLLFNPEVTSIHRVIREGVYPAFSLAVFACFIGMIVRRNEPVRTLLPWMIGSAVSLSVFWLTREERVWIAPSIALMLLVAIILLWKEQRSSFRKRVLVLLAPVVGVGVAVLLVSTINWSRYGVFAITEFDTPEWLAAYGAVSRVTHASWQQYMLVPRETRQRIYQVSPAFAELKPFLEGEPGRGWGTHLCQLLPATCGDIGGGWFMWAMRDAVSRAGHYSSGQEAMSYYRRLAAEINTACDTGALQCSPPRATMLPPWNPVYLAATTKSWLAAARYVVQFDGLSPVSPPSDGDEVGLQLFRVVTRERLAPTGSRARLRIDGWGFGTDSALSMRVRARDNTYADTTFRFTETPGLYDYFLKNEGRRFNNARSAGFSLTTACTMDCKLVLFLNGSEVETLPLDGSKVAATHALVRLYIDAIVPAAEATSFEYRADLLKVAVLTEIARVYRVVSPAATVLGVLGLLISIVAFGFGQRTVLLLIALALLGAILVRLTLVAMIDAMTFPAIIILYLSPAYGMLLLFSALALLAAASSLRAWSYHSQSRRVLADVTSPETERAS